MKIKCFSRLFLFFLFFGFFFVSVFAQPEDPDDIPDAPENSSCPFPTDIGMYLEDLKEEFPNLYETILKRYAPPINPFNQADGMIINAEICGEDALFSFGKKESSTRYGIWKEIHLSRNGGISWDKHTLSYNLIEDGLEKNDSYIDSIAEISFSDFTNKELRDINYIAAYICTEISPDNWKCGCQDEICSGESSAKWSILPFQYSDLKGGDKARCTNFGDEGVSELPQEEKLCKVGEVEITDAEGLDGAFDWTCRMGNTETQCRAIKKGQELALDLGVESIFFDAEERSIRATICNEGDQTSVENVEILFSTKIGSEPRRSKTKNFSLSFRDTPSDQSCDKSSAHISLEELLGTDREEVTLMLTVRVDPDSLLEEENRENNVKREKITTSGYSYYITATPDSPEEGSTDILYQDEEYYAVLVGAGEIMGNIEIDTQFGGSNDVSWEELENERGITLGTYSWEYNRQNGLWLAKVNMDRNIGRYVSMWRFKGGNEPKASVVFEVKDTEDNGPQCGRAHKQGTEHFPDDGLCDIGESDEVRASDGDYLWTCTNEHGSVDCFAPKKTANGKCGVAEGKTFSQFPLDGLCDNPYIYEPIDERAEDSIFNWKCLAEPGTDDEDSICHAYRTESEFYIQQGENRSITKIDAEKYGEYRFIVKGTNNSNDDDILLCTSEGNSCLTEEAEWESMGDQPGWYYISFQEGIHGFFRTNILKTPGTYTSAWKMRGDDQPRASMIFSVEGEEDEPEVQPQCGRAHKNPMEALPEPGPEGDALLCEEGGADRGGENNGDFFWTCTNEHGSVDCFAPKKETYIGCGSSHGQTFSELQGTFLCKNDFESVIEDDIAEFGIFHWWCLSESDESEEDSYCHAYRTENDYYFTYDDGGTRAKGVWINRELRQWIDGAGRYESNEVLLCEHVGENPLYCRNDDEWISLEERNNNGEFWIKNGNLWVQKKVITLDDEYFGIYKGSWKTIDEKRRHYTKYEILGDYYNTNNLRPNSIPRAEDDALRKQWFDFFQVILRWLPI
jgi:hypothetical protein